MLYDSKIDIPHGIGQYDAHRAVEGLTGGARPLFRHMGDHLIIRHTAPLCEDATKVPVLTEGGMTGFMIKAVACKKVKGSRRWFNDWRERHKWLADRMVGADLLHIHATVDSARIKNLPMQFTNFTGILRVRDAEGFNQVIKSGVGGAKCFGAGLILI